MVLWEITLLTAYCLGLKRTYRLALRLQRRLLSKNPRFRSIVFRRTRGVFDVALRVHTTIQQRDIDSNKGLGNRILRLLDRLRPSANIKGSSDKAPPTSGVKPQEQQEPERKQGGGHGSSSSSRVNFVVTNSGLCQLSHPVCYRRQASPASLLLQQLGSPLLNRIKSSEGRQINGYGAPDWPPLSAQAIFWQAFVSCAKEWRQKL